MALLEWVWLCWSGCGLVWNRCGFVGVGVVIVCVGFKTLVLAAWVFCLPSEQDVELSAPLAPCLPGHCHVLALMIMD